MTELRNDISHQCKVMLKVKKNPIRTPVEKLLAEEQAIFRPSRSATEQILNGHILIEKDLQDQRDLYSNLIDLKKLSTKTSTWKKTSHKSYIITQYWWITKYELSFTRQ